MIQHLRNVPYASHTRLFQNAQREVVILCPLVSDPEALKLAQRRCTVHAEMIDAITTQQQIGVAARLEQRIVITQFSVRGVPPDLILVGKKRFGFGALCRCTGHFSQSLGGQNVIIVQQRAPCPPRNGQRGIGRRADMPVFFPEYDAKAAIPPGRIFQNRAHIRQCGAIVSDTAFPPAPGLVYQRVQSVTQIFGQRVIHRHEHGDERFFSERGGGFGRRAIRFRQLSPCIVGRPGQGGTIKIPPAETCAQKFQPRAVPRRTRGPPTLHVENPV